MKIWDAKQRGDKGGKGIGVGLAFVNAYTCLITKVARRFVSVYRSLNEDRDAENLSIAKLYPNAVTGEFRYIQVSGKQ